MKWCLVLLACVAFPGGAFGLTEKPPRTAETATVARVVDGDTLELGDGRKVRLLGVDTPELSSPKKTRRGVRRGARARLVTSVACAATPPSTRVMLRRAQSSRENQPIEERS